VEGRLAARRSGRVHGEAQRDGSGEERGGFDFYKAAGVLSRDFGADYESRGGDDEAFRSRVHLRVGYEELDEEARGKVWRGFLEKVGLEGEEVGRLAGMVMNGRQVSFSLCF
jgi:hypothetical protein